MAALAKTPIFSSQKALSCIPFDQHELAKNGDLKSLYYVAWGTSHPHSGGTSHIHERTDEEHLTNFITAWEKVCEEKLDEIKTLKLELLFLLIAVRALIPIRYLCTINFFDKLDFLAKPPRAKRLYQDNAFSFCIYFDRFPILKFLITSKFLTKNDVSEIQYFWSVYCGSLIAGINKNLILELLDWNTNFPETRQSRFLWFVEKCGEVAVDPEAKFSEQRKKSLLISSKFKSLSDL